jgi:hypothetical protein
MLCSLSQSTKSECTHIHTYIHTYSYHTYRHVKAKAAGALQSLAVDEENQKKIKSLGAIPLITKLLSSRTPEV